MLAHLLRISKEAGNTEGVSDGGDSQVVRKLKCRANKTEIDTDDGGDGPTQMPSEQRTGRGTTGHSDARRRSHVRAHEDSGQDEQPEQLVSIPGTDVRTDQQAPRSEHHAGDD